MDILAQEEREFALFSPFCSMQDASGWYKACPCWGRPLSWCTETNVLTPFGNTLTDTPEVTLYQLPGQPVGQASSHIILTTTGQEQK